MEKSSDDISIKQSLDKKLVKLQNESAAVQTLIAKTNQQEYENLSAIYLWWRASLAVEGYLEDAYKPTQAIRIYKDANDGTNFRRLLYLMYGIYGINEDNLSRKNRALCELHAEYEKNTALYIKDGKSKLAGYIKSQGGVDGLIKSSKATDERQQLQQSSTSSTFTAKSIAEATYPTPALASSFKEATFNTTSSKPTQTYKPRIEVKISEGMRQSALLNEAASYFAQNITSQQININPPIATNKDGYGLALVKRNGSSYDVIGATDSTQGICELLVSAYRKQYAAMPNSMRCFFEIIKTQSLPHNLQRLFDKLIELSFDKHDDKTRKKIQRRVLYIASENTLVLSPTYSRSGVVTVAKLKTMPFEGNVTDCFMPTRCRKMIEQRMLATHDFNLFSPNSKDRVPQYNVSGLASHMLRLDNKAKQGDFVFVEFWPFEMQMGDANEQLYYASSFTRSCRTKLTLKQSELQTFAYDHINLWLASYGEHITRPANKLVELSITNNGFEFGFDYVNKVFRNRTSSPFETPLQDNIDYSATFLSKDLCLALHSIGELQLAGDIEIACSSEALILSYATAAAEYTVVVPTTNELRRNEAAFCTYAPKLAEMSDPYFEDDNEIYEDLMLEQALAATQAPLKADVTDKSLGIDVDEFELMIDGFLPQEYEVDDIEWLVSSEDR